MTPMLEGGTRELRCAERLAGSERDDLRVCAWDREYTYDADGNIESIGDDQFAYDDLGRLTAAIIDGSTQGYTYDDFGNLTSTTRPGSTTVSVPADPMTNRMIGETYDAAGNVTSRKARGTYAYDALNMIVEMGMTPGISRRRILYDANDERIGTLIDAMLQTANG